jgi:hypothetical protein
MNLKGGLKSLRVQEFKSLRSFVDCWEGERVELLATIKRFEDIKNDHIFQQLPGKEKLKMEHYTFNS